MAVNTKTERDQRGQVVKRGKTLYSARSIAKGQFKTIENTTEELNRTIMGHARKLDDAHHRYGDNVRRYGGVFETRRIKEILDQVAI